MNHNHLADASGFSRAGTFELGSDPFNLMPIIKQLQHKGRKKLRRHRINGGFLMGSSLSIPQDKLKSPLSELGKRLQREGQEFEAPPKGRRKLMDKVESIILSAEVDEDQPRRE